MTNTTFKVLYNIEGKNIIENLLSGNDIDVATRSPTYALSWGLQRRARMSKPEEVFEE